MDKPGVVYDVPVATCVVSPASLYHVIVPVPTAVNVTVPVPQREAGVTVGGLGILLTVAVTGSLVVEIHPVAVFLASA